MIALAPRPTADQVATLARFKIAGHFDHLAMMRDRHGEKRPPLDPAVARLTIGQHCAVPHGEVASMLALGWIQHVPPGGRFRLTDLGEQLLAIAAGIARRSRGGA